MESLIFTINPGSTSKKYGLYQAGEELAIATIESLGDGRYLGKWSLGEDSQEQPVDHSVFENATDWALDKCLSGRSVEELSACAVRMVGPGKLFSQHQRVSDKLIKELESNLSQAPLHISPVLKELNQLKKLHLDTSIWAISDSAFHHTLPDKSRYYGIDLDDAKRFDIMRYGYHGISLAGAMNQLEQMSDHLPEKVIACHLGGGASITAIHQGQSRDTSMGLTPLEGLLMNSRGGDLDDGAVIRLAQQSGMNLLALEEYLYKKCGLLGVSGKTGDIRELIELEQSGHERAKLALEMFVYRIQKYIGSYIAVLGGIDVLIFTGTIGERSSIIRERVVSGLDCFGLILDQDKNKQVFETNDWINPDKAPAGIAVIATDEMKQIAIETGKLIR